jgi:phage gpG-like protein
MIALETDMAAAEARLARLASAVRACAADVVAREGQALLDAARANLPGGALSESLRLDVRDSAQGAEARVANDLAYARITEYGGRIAVPETAPTAAKVLAFPYQGKLVFAAHARAHDVEIPARPYLAPALEVIARVFADELRTALGDLA